MMDSEPASTSAQVDSGDKTHKLKRSHSSPPPQGDHENLPKKRAVIPPSLAPASAPAPAPAPAPVQAQAKCLCVDDLMYIFRNSCISTRDLLNFRLVSKLWGDAASSTLRRRNAVYIAQSQNNWPLCRQRTLTQLTDLISNSSYFPVSTFHLLFEAYCPSNDNLPPPPPHPDALEFFELHGENVKELSLTGSIALEPLLEILSTYSSNIESVNLKGIEFLHVKPKAEGWKSPHLIPITTLAIGEDGHQFDAQALHILLSSCPKLRSIKSVNRWTLRHILKEKKAELIRSFDYSRPPRNSSHTATEAYVSLMTQFADVSPGLLSLKLELDDIRYHRGLVASINALLESSKDTLRKLQLFIMPFDDANIRAKLKIFPMKNLKSICLGSQYLLERTLGEDETFSIWKDEMSAPQIFPTLVKICLTNFNPKNIMELFQFKLETHADGTTAAVAVNNSLPAVQTILMQGLCLPWDNAPISNPNLISLFFPNLCRLEIECIDFKNFGSELWNLFPCVEYISLYNISCAAAGLYNKVNILTDLVFTGFALNTCAQLRSSHFSGFHQWTEPEGFFPRITPSILDMRRLKEFKLAFAELWTEFASKVTGMYAFSKMPHTSFIISYDPYTFSLGRDQYIGEHVNHEELCFGSLRPYVQIVQVSLKPHH